MSNDKILKNIYIKWLKKKIAIRRMKTKFKMKNKWEYNLKFKLNGKIEKKKQIHKKDPKQKIKIKRIMIKFEKK
jgi:hypothetical protein